MVDQASQTGFVKWSLRIEMGTFSAHHCAPLLQVGRGDGRVLRQSVHHAVRGLLNHLQAPGGDQLFRGQFGGAKVSGQTAAEADG
ncbi:hypothetical protein GCM10025857_20860 [Alicyclobacillus contaminans]|nr:hypothetical protein GCM10025857_20860 [Alicyclobacillus contaminans]